MNALWVKRSVDVLGACVLLIVLAPVMFAAAVAVWLTMGRPVLWADMRPGKNAVPFTMFKFRSMRPPQPGEDYLRTDAQRLTSLGRMLRRTSIDELPELLNVLKGDMSLVGPRPLLLDYIPRYTAEQGRRHEVRPGVTGWAQVNGRQLIPLSQRLTLDVWYIDNRTLWLDFRILFMTARQATTGHGVVSGQNFDSLDDLEGKSNEPRRTSER